MSNARLTKAIAGQFSNPHGLLGGLAGWIMASRGSNRARNAWVVDQLDIQPHHRVLEIGFGPGLAIELVAKRLTNGFVCGIDHSETMLTHATRRNVQRLGDGTVRLWQTSLEDLVQGSVVHGSADLRGPFDRIFAVNSAMFWKDLDTATAHLATLLAPAGLLAIMHQPRLKPATDEQAQKAAQKYADSMRRAGLGPVEVRVMKSLSPTPVCALGTK